MRVNVVTELKRTNVRPTAGVQCKNKFAIQALISNSLKRNCHKIIKY